MVEYFTHLIIILNALLLIVLIIGIRRWQRKHGKVTEKTLALILTGYFSFTSIIASLPLIKINFQVVIVVNLFFLLIFWGIGYPWIRWLYRQFNSSKH